MHSICTVARTRNDHARRGLSKQGDQIGQIFAQWVTVYFGQFMKITALVQIFGHLFAMGKVMH
jgi:hypothetical protein